MGIFTKNYDAHLDDVSKMIKRVIEESATEAEKTNVVSKVALDAQLKQHEAVKGAINAGIGQYYGMRNVQNGQVGGEMWLDQLTGKLYPSISLSQQADTIYPSQVAHRRRSMK